MMSLTQIRKGKNCECTLMSTERQTFDDWLRRQFICCTLSWTPRFPRRRVIQSDLRASLFSWIERDLFQLLINPLNRIAGMLLSWHICPSHGIDHKHHFNHCFAGIPHCDIIFCNSTMKLLVGAWRVHICTSALVAQELRSVMNITQACLWESVSLFT